MRIFLALYGSFKRKCWILLESGARVFWLSAVVLQEEIHCPALAWAYLFGIEHLPYVIPGYRLYYHPHFCEPGVCPFIVATLLKLIDLQIQSVYRNQETTIPNRGPEMPISFTFQALNDCFILYGSGGIKCTVKSWVLPWVHNCFCSAAVEVHTEPQITYISKDFW